MVWLKAEFIGTIEQLIAVSCKVLFLYPCSSSNCSDKEKWVTGGQVIDKPFDTLLSKLVCKGGGGKDLYPILHPSNRVSFAKTSTKVNRSHKLQSVCLPTRTAFVLC